MNKELKHLLQIGIGLLTIILICINIIYDHHSSNFINRASKPSQIIATNRLRAARLNRPSEKWAYPKVKHFDQLILVAVKSSNQLFVINQTTKRAIYIMHAKIDVPKTQHEPFKVQQARGQEIFHIHGSKQTTGQSWLSLSKQVYIEAPITDLNQHHVSNSLLKVTPNNQTIYVTTHDAQWLQQLPAGTPLYVQEKK